MKNPTVPRQTYYTVLMPPRSLTTAFNRLVRTAPPGSIIEPPDDLHITLNRLHIPKKRSLRDLTERLARIEFDAFDIRMRGLGSYFRIPRKNISTHVLWMSPDPVAMYRIQDLHARILLSLRPVGYTVGWTQIDPHLTVLKYPYKNDPSMLEAFVRANGERTFPVWPCDGFYLVKSVNQQRTTDPATGRSSKGMAYEMVARFPLCPPQAAPNVLTMPGYT